MEFVEDVAGWVVAFLVDDLIIAAVRRLRRK